MMHLRTLETTKNRRARKEFKLSLIKRLYEQGHDRQDIINLYGLIDWMMTIPEELQEEFNQQITQYEQEMKMPYITSIERSGEVKGKLIQTQQIVKRQLHRRIGEIDFSLIHQVEALPIEVLEELTDALLDFSTIADFEQWLENRSKPEE
jgi:hypothetical protein